MRSGLLVACLLLVPGAGTDRPASWANLPLADAPTPLLAGHLVLRLPTTAVIEPRARGLMAAPEADEAETRVVIDLGKRRIVLMVSELYRTAPDDLVAGVSAWLAPLREDHDPLEVMLRALPDGGELRAVVARPGRVDATAAAVPLLWVVVAHGDGLLQHLGFYANPAAARDLPAATEFALSLLDTLRAGPRRLQGEARSIDVDRAADRTLRLDLPADAGCALQVGDDFEVHQVQLIVPLGQPGGVLGIYSGSMPEAPADSPVHQPATVLGQPVEWLLHEEVDEGETIHVADLLLPHPLRGRESLHLFVEAETPGPRDRLMQIAGTLRLQP